MILKSKASFYFKRDAFGFRTMVLGCVGGMMSVFNKPNEEVKRTIE